MQQQNEDSLLLFERTEAAVHEEAYRYHDTQGSKCGTSDGLTGDELAQLEDDLVDNELAVMCNNDAF